VTSAGGLNGVIISEVQPSSAAERAGLKSAVYERRGNQIVGIVSADVIVGVNGKKVAKTEDLFLELDRHQAGDKVKLEVQRGNETLNVEVELQYLQAN
jgi:S1-C subfamily serine protease